MQMSPFLPVRGLVDIFERFRRNEISVRVILPLLVHIISGVQQPYRVAQGQVGHTAPSDEALHGVVGHGHPGYVHLL